MDRKLIPAPIDEKNVTSDWIAEIFDNFGDCVMNGKKYTGFVKDSVCFCEYVNNHLFWYIPKDLARDAKASWDELIRRLKERDTPPLVVKYDEFLKSEHLLGLEQTFYWNNY